MSDDLIQIALFAVAVACAIFSIVLFVNGERHHAVLCLLLGIALLIIDLTVDLSDRSPPRREYREMHTPLEHDQ